MMAHGLKFRPYQTFIVNSRFYGTEKSGRLPSGLSSKLIHGQRSKLRFPDVQKSLSLARNLAQAEVTCDEFVRKVSFTYKAAMKKSHYQDFHNLKEIKGSHLESSVRNLEEYMEKMDAAPAYMNVSGGLLYFQCFYRIVEILENRAKLQLMPLEFSNKNLIYTQWLVYFLHEDIINSQGILNNNLEIICEFLIADLQEYAKEYEKNHKVVSRNVPKIFNPGSIETFVDNLLKKNEEMWPSVVAYQMLTCKSLALWNSGLYSNCLVQMAAILEFFLKNLEDAEVITELGPLVISTFSVMLKKITEQNLEPAINFLEVLMDKLKSKVPLLPYIIYVHFLQSPETATKAQGILKSNPSIEKLLGKYPKFEKALVNPRMTENNKSFFIRDMLRNLDHSEFTKEKLGRVSFKVLQEMVDIQILELLHNQDFEGAVQAIQDETKKGISPSVDTIKAILSNNCSAENLEHLRLALPIATDLYDLVSDREVLERCQRIHFAWKSDKQESMLKMLTLYQSLIEDEYQVSDQMVDILLRRVLLYLRLFMEESLLTKEDTRAVYEFAKQLNMAHDHFDLLALYWETFFFSDDFKHQSHSDQIIQENARLPRFLNFDHLVNRATNYENEFFFRKLLELSLQFDLPVEAKSRAMEGLLIFQCERGNLLGAKATIASSISLESPISAEAMKSFLQLKRDFEQDRQNSIWNQIAEVFSRSKRTE